MKQSERIRQFALACEQFLGNRRDVVDHLIRAAVTNKDFHIRVAELAFRGLPVKHQWKMQKVLDDLIENGVINISAYT